MNLVKVIKKLLIFLLLAVILVAGAAGYLWHDRHYLRIDSQLYSKDLAQLDLRGQQISVKQYEKFRSKLPNCEILWDVPFQGGALAQDTAELTITSLSDQDMEMLDYLTELQYIDATGCTDYGQLQKLQQRCPEVEIDYQVAVGGGSYDPNVSEITVTSIAEEELPRLRYLNDLKTVILGGVDDISKVVALREYCHEQGYALQIRIGDMLVQEDIKALTASGMQEGECALLALLPDLKQLHLLNPEASVETLLALQQQNPELELTWNQEVCGTMFSSTDTQIDISGREVEDMEVLARQMTYFPNAEKLIMSDCGIDNETMAAFREEHREDYKVVWTVQLGDKLTARTDDTTFMPVREGVYYFQDHESGNLKYCEDMVCIDVGHMAIHDISFVEYMPNLQYLILAHTEVRDITPLENCKKLIFLELDWSTVRDFTPLLGCTALQDLNVGETYPDLAPLAKMTWLNNLWMVGRTTGAYEVAQALTETKIVTSGSATVAGGWRDLPNYYAMRDLLEMHYMSW